MEIAHNPRISVISDGIGSKEEGKDLRVDVNKMLMPVLFVSTSKTEVSLVCSKLRNNEDGKGARRRLDGLQIQDCLEQYQRAENERAIRDKKHEAEASTLVEYKESKGLDLM